MPNWKKVITSGSDAILNEITSSGGILTSQDIMPDVDNTLSLGSSTQRFQLNGGTPVTVDGNGSSNTITRFQSATTVENSTISNTDSLTTITHDNDGNDIFIISGSNGELLKVTDTIGESLFQVNDGSGITHFEISSSGTLVAQNLEYVDQTFVLTYNSQSGNINFFSASALVDTPTLQEVTDVGATTTNSITIDGGSDASLTLDRNATNNDAEIVFTTNGTENWSIGTGQVGGDNDFTFRSYGSSNAIRFDQDGHINAQGSITGSDISIDDWGSVSASLASLDATSNPTLQNVTDNGNTTTNNIVVGQVDGLNPSQNEHVRLKSGSIEFEGTSTTSSVRLTNELTPGGDQNFAIQTDFNQNGFFQDNLSITFEGNSVVEGRSAVQFTVANDNTPTSSIVFTEDKLEFVKDQIGSPWVTITGSKDITIQDWGSVSASLATLSAFGSPSSPAQGVVAIDGNNVNLGLQSSDSPTFTNLTLSGDLTVNGDTVTLNTSQLHIEDKLISVASGSTTSAQADGAGLHISGANESLTWDNSNTRFKFSDALYTDGGITANGDVDADDVTIDDWGSVSASLASINSDSSNLTLQDVTDNGSTTTNALTINNGTLGATSLHVDGNHDFPLKVTSDNLTGDPYMELGGDGIRLVDPVNEDLKIRIGPSNDVTLVARFEYDPNSSNRNFLMQGTGSISGYDIIATNSLTLSSLNNANADTDKFLVIDSAGTVKYRSGAELRSDIGAGEGNGSVTSVGGTGTVSGLSLSGTVTTSGNLTLGGTISIDASNITDVDAFSQTGTYSGLRAQATTKGDVGLGNVENTALSTWGGSSNITTLGTISSGTWQGSAIDTAYISNLSGTNTGDEPDASATVKGIIEIATNAEVTTGTDTSRAITPSSLTSITKLGTVTTGDVSAILPSGVISASGQLGIDDTDDVSEGSTNLYYTDARVKTKLSAEGVISGSSQVVLNDAIKTGFDTDDVTEGSTNLYYTDTRVRQKLDAEGVISGSSQVDINSTSGTLTTLGTVTSGDVSAILPSGVISGSVQVNADSITNFDSNVKDKMNADSVLSGSGYVNVTGTPASNRIAIFSDSDTIKADSDVRFLPSKTPQGYNQYQYDATTPDTLFAKAVKTNGLELGDLNPSSAAPFTASLTIHTNHGNLSNSSERTVHGHSYGVGTTVIYENVATSATMFYQLGDSSNAMRAGHLTAINNGTDVNFVEYMTQDIGSGRTTEEFQVSLVLNSDSIQVMRIAIIATQAGEISFTLDRMYSA